MDELTQRVDEAITDFLKVTSLAGNEIVCDEIDVEILPKPHKPPSRLPYRKMAVYSFFLDGMVLKVGKAGPNSHARYSSQHYNASSAASTLAGSILRNPRAVGLSNLDPNAVGRWIRQHTDRVNLLLPADAGDPLLSLLEAFLHYRWQPAFEGRS